MGWNPGELVATYDVVVTMMSSDNDVRIGSKPGHRLVTVTLDVENTGLVSFRSDIEEHSWLVDRDDRAYGHNAELTKGKSPFASHLAPRWSVNRCVVFEVPADVDITRFRLESRPAFVGADRGLAPRLTELFSGREPCNHPRSGRRTAKGPRFGA